MIALFFEVLPRAGHQDTYFEIAASLRPELDKNPGLIFIDRYRSIDRPGWILSHQYWRDEASMVRWRTNARHYLAQTAGRHQHFADYRLRVARVIVDAAPGHAAIETTELAAYNDPALTAPRYVVAIVRTRPERPIDDGEDFSSVYRPGEHATLVVPRDRAEGEFMVRNAVTASGIAWARLCLVSRDYGMHERAEAPQVFAAR
jgi:heme-degrading monooxygenase HmoA